MKNEINGVSLMLLDDDMEHCLELLFLFCGSHGGDHEDCRLSGCDAV
jgi:hypothetical protein